MPKIVGSRKIKVIGGKGAGKIQSIREGSFNIHAPRLFNSLPMEIINLTKISVDDFKIKLDKYLEKLPDEPKVGVYIPSSQVHAVKSQ